MNDTISGTGNTVAVIGAGASGLVTAHILSKDGFNVHVLTRDKSPGGVWARQRVYPGLKINNVHGEYRFSALPMPPPSKASETGGRLSGEDMCNYMENYADTYLKGKIKFEVEVLKIRRSTDGLWTVHVKDRHGIESHLEYARIVLCTGGCSAPNLPQSLSPAVARAADFRGLVIHSQDFAQNLDDILARTEGDSGPKSVVVVGGGKSAQDTAAYLANTGRKVSVVFGKADAVLAAKIPLPDFVRRSRLLGILSPHIYLHTRLERFLHTTWLGSKITHFIWDKIKSLSLNALELPEDSPFRKGHCMFWGIRTSDEGVYRPNSFYAAVNRGEIAVVSPARVESFGADGGSVILNDGKSLPADVLILATGYTSSWSGLFDAEAAKNIGIGRHTPPINVKDPWESYTSLKNSPSCHPRNKKWASSIYRGIIPAKNIENHDFAINGAVFSANNGYTYEISAHWISSYFLKDKMRLPSSAEEAISVAELNTAWLRKRFPEMLSWFNESYSSGICLWDWSQYTDTLLDDMYLPYLRSGGNWITWPFKIIELDEIANLEEERRERRLATTQ